VTKHLPPDAAMLELAKVVNAKLKPLASINLYRIENDDGSKLTGIVFECGSRRANVTTRNEMSAHDAPDLIRSAEEWIGRRRGASDRWSTDPDDAAPLDWRTML